MTKPKTQKKILYIDMDGVLVDFNSMLEEKNLVTEKEIDAYVDNTKGIFLDLKPMPGAIKAFEFLSKHFETFILTTAPWKNTSAWTDKRKWIGKYLPETGEKKLIITHRKDLNKGNYLIDDRKAKGSDKFKGELIHFGSEEFKNWNSVLEYLCKREGIAK